MQPGERWACSRQSRASLGPSDTPMTGPRPEGHAPSSRHGLWWLPGVEGTAGGPGPTAQCLCWLSWPTGLLPPLRLVLVTVKPQKCKRKQNIQNLRVFMHTLFFSNSALLFSFLLLYSVTIPVDSPFLPVHSFLGYRLFSSSFFFLLF